MRRQAKSGKAWAAKATPRISQEQVAAGKIFWLAEETPWRWDKRGLSLGRETGESKPLMALQRGLTRPAHACV